VLRVFPFCCSVRALQCDLTLVRDLDRLIDQISNNFVTIGRDANRLVALHTLDDHVGANVGLAGAGRPLDRQNATLEMAA